MRTLENTTVAEEVNRNLRTGEIFRKYGIDYCCNGQVPIKTAAETALANIISLEKELKMLDSAGNETEDGGKLEPEALVDHLVQDQHGYLRDNIPVIVYYAARVAQRNAESFPELIQIQRFFSEAASKLEAQMKMKETELFPCIKKMHSGDFEYFEVKICGGKLKDCLNRLKEEHLETIYLFKKIASLTNGYIVPVEVRNPFRILYQQLEEFEQKLYHLFHLQHNILFPKAIQLEQELFGA